MRAVPNKKCDDAGNKSRRQSSRWTAEVKDGFCVHSYGAGITDVQDSDSLTAVALTRFPFELSIDASAMSSQQLSQPLSSY